MKEQIIDKKIIIKFIDAFLFFWGKIAYQIYFLFGWRIVSLSGGWIAFIKYFLDKTKHEILKNELQELFGNRYANDKIKKIVRKSFRVYYTRQVETFFLGAINKQTINNILDVEGLEHVDDALKDGKGVILLLAHFGSFLLPLPFFGFNNYKINQITGNQIPSSKIADRMWVWRKKEASKLPVTYISADGFLRPVFKALKNNEIVVIAFDGRDGSKWVEVDFFDKKALFSPGPFDIARRTGSAIIPTFVKQKNKKVHQMKLEPRFELSKDADKKKAVKIDTINFANLFQEYVLCCPCHFGKIIYNYKIQNIMGTANPFFSENK